MSLRAAGEADRDFVLALGVEAFGHLGDYAAILGGWFDHPEVAGTIATAAGRPVGFALWAFTQPDQGAPIALDLVGIAVSPGHRRRGVGRALLRDALARGQAAPAASLATCAALSVAVDNEGARRLFASEGFRDRGEAPIRYPAGQVAVRLSRALARPPEDNPDEVPARTRAAEPPERSA